MSSQQVKFGIQCPMYPPMENCLQAITRAEKLGWDFIEYPDQLTSTHPLGMLHPPVPKNDPSMPTSFFSEIWYGSFEMTAAAAVLTDRVELNLGVVDALRRAPSVMAQEFATLNHMSKGRLVISVGAGEMKQFEPYGLTRDKPFARMEEAIKTWKALWASEGKPISRASEFWPLKEAVFPIPLYDGKRPRILATGGGDTIFRMVGEVCDGWVTFLPGGCNNSPEIMADSIDKIKQFARNAGREDHEFTYNSHPMVVLAETDDEAWRLARSPNVGWVVITAASIDSGKTWEKLGHKNPLGKFFWSKDISVTSMSRADVEKLAPEIPDELTDVSMIWGGPERVARRLQTYIDAGMNEIMFVNMAASADPEQGTNWNRLVSDVLVRLGRKPLNLE
jgi:phthiodiolone/phenolphthiodiolone dimycocerosates ketoreductase